MLTRSKFSKEFKSKVVLDRENEKKLNFVRILSKIGGVLCCLFLIILLHKSGR